MKIEEIMNNLKKRTDGNYNRVGTTFETEYSRYYYDAGTGKVFECDDNEYILLKNLIENSSLENINETVIHKEDQDEALNCLYSLICKENLFQLPKYDKFQSQGENHVLEIGKNLRQLILELTEKCNLRCKYCIYDDTKTKFRNFDKNDLTWEIAKKAIDYFIENAEEKPSITFYGGEPLLSYELMKQCIDYSIIANQGKKEISFGFTTNLTLLTKEMAEYFTSIDRCNITVSLDGPEEMHDRNRITKNGKGSFHDVIQRLKLLIDCMGVERAKKSININAVFPSSYTVKELKQINDFFLSLSWLPSGINVRMNYEDNENTGRLKEEYISYYQRDMEAIDPVSYMKMKYIEHKTEDEFIFSKDNVDLMLIQDRLICEQPIPFLKQNGCCIPGNRRLYVTTQGKYKVCERIGESPFIGDVEKGIDIELIKKFYIDDYADASLEECKNCWAAHLCTICFTAFYDEKGINNEKKKNICIGHKSILKQHLIMYHQILETNPEYLQELAKDTLV